MPSNTVLSHGSCQTWYALNRVCLRPNGNYLDSVRISDTGSILSHAVYTSQIARVFAGDNWPVRDLYSPVQPVSLQGSLSFRLGRGPDFRVPGVVFGGPQRGYRLGCEEAPDGAGGFWAKERTFSGSTGRGPGASHASRTNQLRHQRYNAIAGILPGRPWRNLRRPRRGVLADIFFGRIRHRRTVGCHLVLGVGRLPNALSPLSSRTLQNPRGSDSQGVSADGIGTGRDSLSAQTTDISLARLPQSEVQADQGTVHLSGIAPRETRSTPANPAHQRYPILSSGRKRFSPTRALDDDSSIHELHRPNRRSAGSRCASPSDGRFSAAIVLTPHHQSGGSNV